MDARFLKLREPVRVKAHRSDRQGQGVLYRRFARCLPLIVVRPKVENF